MTENRQGNLVAGIVENLHELTLSKCLDDTMANVMANRDLATAGKSILSLRETTLMKGRSALIIGAGPSLHRADFAMKIKQSGYQGLILATESTLAWCLRNEIVPDLVATLDPHPNRILRWFGDPNLTEESVRQDRYFANQELDHGMRESELIYNQDVLALMNRHGHGIKIAVCSSAAPALVNRLTDIGMDIHWWNPIVDDPDEPQSHTRVIQASNRKPCLNSLGNVGAFCWVMAHSLLEKTQIGLIGMDMSCYADAGYQSAQYYNDLVDIYGIENVKEAFTHIYNPYISKEFICDPTYLWYRQEFLSMAEEMEKDGIVTYNCTGGGVLFGPGIEFTDIDTFFSVVRSTTTAHS